MAKYEMEQKSLKLRIEKAQKILPNVQIAEGLLYEIANVCSKLAVSNRAPIVVARTAKTLAAFSERDNVNKDDVLEAMELALPHRMRKKPFERPYLPRQKLEELISKNNCENHTVKDEGSNFEKSSKPSGELLFDASSPTHINLEGCRRWDSHVGKSGRSVTAKIIGGGRGAYVYSVIPKGKASDVAIDATIRAAAARAIGCKEATLKISDEDIREKVRRIKTSSLIILVVDASGSMAARKRMEVAKGATLGLLNNAYTRRDKVAFIAFRGASSELLLPPTSSLDLAHAALKELPTGGRTPLSHALLTTLNMIQSEKMKNTISLKPSIVLITDGKANVSLGGEIRQEIVELCGKLKETGAQLTVIDVSEDPFTPNYIEDIIKAANAKHVKIRNLTDDNLQKIITANMLSKDTPLQF